jgi:hypothetical protein
MSSGQQEILTFPEAGVDADAGPTPDANLTDVNLTDVNRTDAGFATVSDGGGVPPGRVQIAASGNLLLDLSPDGQYALVANPTSGALSLAPTGSGTLLPAGNLGTAPSGGVPAGRFVPHGNNDQFMAYWDVQSQSMTVGPLWVGALGAPAVMVDANAVVDLQTRGGMQGMATSPDGLHALYWGNAASRTTVDLLRLDLVSPTSPVVVLSAISLPLLTDFAADGTGVAFLADGTIRTIDTSGALATIASNVPTSWGTYSQVAVIGQSLFLFDTVSDLHQYAIPSGASTLLSHGAYIFFPYYGPGGPGITYSAAPTPTSDWGAYRWTPTGGTTLLASGVHQIAASPSGRYVVGGGATGAQVYDLTSATPMIPTTVGVCPHGCIVDNRTTWWGAGESYMVFMPIGGTVGVTLPSGPQVALTPADGALFDGASHVLLGGEDILHTPSDLYLFNLPARTGSLFDRSVLRMLLVPGASTPTVVYATGTELSPTGVFTASLP